MGRKSRGKRRNRSCKDEVRPPRTGYDALRMAVPSIEAIAKSAARRLTPSSVSETIQPQLFGEDQVAIAYLEDHVRQKVAKGWALGDAADDADLLGAHLQYAVNFEMHHRKTFWVDTELSAQLAETVLDIDAEVLRLPFPCCAFVFRDAEMRHLMRELIGLEDKGASNVRTVTVMFVQLDAVLPARGLSAYVLGDNELPRKWPFIIGRDLVLEPGANLDVILDSHFPGIDVSSLDQMFLAPQLIRLLNIAFNAVLYSTSAGVESRSVPAWRPTRRRRRQPLGSAGQVFYLPGKITICHGHRTDGDPPEPSGRKLTKRVLVRGHWRRANPLWVDQRLRWVEPHFRGPDMAALIEREYQLAPQKQDESEVPP